MNACCSTVPHGAALPTPALPFLRRWWSALLRRPAPLAGIRDLDPRMLKDIGVCIETLPMPETGASARRGLDFPVNGAEDPAAVVQRQLEAYNRRDLAALLACYAEDARQYEFPATLLAQGRAAIGERMAARFADPRLHARLRQRSVMGALVIDQEEITRSAADGGRGAQERVGLVAIYRVEQGLIRQAIFAFGPLA